MVWLTRVNRGQELVIGGYIPGTHGLDSIIVGYYKRNDLIYVARVRHGFAPVVRMAAILGSARLSVRQSAGETPFALGRRSDSRGHKEVRVAAA
jgi:hypothetical protein